MGLGTPTVYPHCMLSVLTYTTNLCLPDETEAQQVPAGWGDGNAHLVWLVLMSKVKARRVGSHPLAQ